MELIQLKYFVTIAETTSFTGAAELLHVSQPAISYQIKRLEEELGTRLFDRKSRRIALTQDGALLLPMAQSVLFRADETVRVLKEHLGVEVGEVRMGSNPSVATYLCPDILNSFRKDYPKVRVEVIEGGDLELQYDVQKGSVDFAVVTAPGPQTLDVIRLGAEDLLVVLSATNHLAGRGTVDLHEMAQEQFVLPTGAYNLTSQVIDACRRAGFEPNVAYRAHSIEAIKNFVRLGLGVSILPRISLNEAGSRDLTVMPVTGGLTRQLNLIWGKDRSITRAAQALMTQVRVSVTETLKNWPPSDSLSVGAPDGKKA